MNKMDKDFINLKLQIEYLIDSYEKVLQENKVLKKRLTELINQKSMYLERKNSVIKKINRLITKIKDNMDKDNQDKEDGKPNERN